EVALAVDQRIAEAKVLRLTHQRVVRGNVAVRVILADDVAHDAGGLDMTRWGIEAQLVHCVEDASLHWLLPVRDIGQRAAHYHAHRIFEVATLCEFGERKKLFVACPAISRPRRNGGRAARRRRWDTRRDGR